MAVLLFVARLFLWLETFVFSVGGMSILLLTPDGNRGQGSAFFRLVAGILAVAGVLGLIANLSWRSKPALSRWLAIVAAVPMLLLVPVGTPFGIVMLIAFIARRVAAEPVRERQLSQRNMADGVKTAVIVVATLAGNFLILESLRARHGLLSQWVLLLVPPVLLLSTAIHEAGHILFGMTNGMQPQMYMVGPFCWIRLADGWKFAVLPRAYPMMMQGGCASTTPIDSQQLARRLAWMIFGGPLFQCAAGIGFIAAFLWMDAAAWPWLAHATGITGLFCVLGLSNLVPGRDGAMSDGALLQNLWRGGVDRAQEEARWLVDQPYVTAKRFGEIDPGPLVDQSSPSFADMMLARYYHALDQGHVAIAGECLDAAVAAQASGKVRARDRICALEAAWFAAAYRGDDRARSRLPRAFHGLPIDRFVELRAEAALCRVEGSEQKAAAAVAEARNLLARCEPTGWTALNHRMLDAAPAIGLERATAA